MKTEIRKIVTTALGLACGALAAGLPGCAKESVDPGRATMAELAVVGAKLEESTNGAAQSRAVEANNKTFTFETGDAMSLFMRSNNNFYTDVNNRKVTYGATPDAEAGTWTIADKPIMLGRPTAVVSLVYPYTASAVFDNIPFETGVYETGKDLLLRQQLVDLADNEAEVESMSHALTRVKLIIRRDDHNILGCYTGKGVVTSVSVGNGTATQDANAVVFTKGKLDLSYKRPDSPVSGVMPGTVSVNTGFTLTPKGDTVDLLMLPVKEITKDLVTLKITVDNVEKVVSFPYINPAPRQWDPGNCYVYTVTVKNKTLDFESTAEFGDWGQGGNNDSDAGGFTPI